MIGKNTLKNILPWWKINKFRTHLSKKPIKSLFTILLLRLKKGLLGKKLPVVVVENPTVRIRRRLFQVFYNILLVNFIRLKL